jgi:hypothetical protein
MYRERIQALAPTHDPRLIEAFMRVGHSTLDGLSPNEFKREVRLSAACIDEAGVEFSEQIAKSVGL